MITTVNGWLLEDPQTCRNPDCPPELLGVSAAHLLSGFNLYWGPDWYWWGSEDGYWTWRPTTGANFDEHGVPALRVTASQPARGEWYLSQNCRRGDALEVIWGIIGA